MGRAGIATPLRIAETPPRRSANAPAWNWQGASRSWSLFQFTQGVGLNLAQNAQHCAPRITDLPGNRGDRLSLQPQADDGRIARRQPSQESFEALVERRHVFGSRCSFGDLVLTFVGAARQARLLAA